MLGAELATGTVEAFGPASPLQPLAATIRALTTAKPANRAPVPITTMMPEWILKRAPGRRLVDNRGKAEVPDLDTAPSRAGANIYPRVGRRRPQFAKLHGTQAVCEGAAGRDHGR